MANTREKLDWQSLDTTSFGGPIGKAWKAYTQQREAIQPEIDKLRAKLTPFQEELEREVARQLIADGLMSQAQRAQFAYRFGGMAFAVTDAPTGGSKGKVVLGSSKGKGK